MVSIDFTGIQSFIHQTDTSSISIALRACVGELRVSSASGTARRSLHLPRDSAGPSQSAATGTLRSGHAISDIRRTLLQPLLHISNQPVLLVLSQDGHRPTMHCSVHLKSQSSSNGLSSASTMPTAPIQPTSTGPSAWFSITQPHGTCAPKNYTTFPDMSASQPKRNTRSSSIAVTAIALHKGAHVARRWAQVNTSSRIYLGSAPLGGTLHNLNGNACVMGRSRFHCVSR
jgi:hypothetical protein